MGKPLTMKQQSIIDLIGWTLFVIMISLFLMLMFGCGTAYSTTKWDYDAPAAYNKQCDHFYINKSKLTSDPKIIGETVPCICIHCKDIQVCKNESAYFFGQYDLIDPIILTTPYEFGLETDILYLECQHTNMMRTMMGCSPPSNQCNDCTCLDCGYSYKCN